MAPPSEPAGNALSTAVAHEPLVTQCYEAIDRYHVNERLGEMLREVEPDAALRAQQLTAWNDALDANDSTIDDIRAWLADSHASVVATGDAARAERLGQQVTYFRNNAARMRYASLVAHRLPVGSGATEGACKSVIGARTKRSGQRWRPDGLEAVLTLRATYMSARLPAFWSHLARTYRKEVSKCT